MASAMRANYALKLAARPAVVALELAVGGRAAA
jgi:hypothetical protein